MSVSHSRYFLLALVVAASSLAGACRRSACTFVRTEEAEFFLVRGEYSLVIPHPSFMQASFGADWASQSLFYSSNRAISETGQPFIVNSGTPRQPLVKGTPILIISGTEWPDLYCALYSLERKQFVGLHINLQKHTLTADAPTTPSYGLPEVLPNGTLTFK